jgi:hypothetical protein
MRRWNWRSVEALKWKSVVPANPKIYHITHLENLARMSGVGLLSDAERIRQGLQCTNVGMKEIKRRRLEELGVSCHPTTRVVEYVPVQNWPDLLHK